MESYWPNTTDRAGATKHDISHAAWCKTAHKLVLNSTLKPSEYANTMIIANNGAMSIGQIKQYVNGEILLFESPSTARLLLTEELIDVAWLFVSPIILAEGIPWFKGVGKK